MTQLPPQYGGNLSEFAGDLRTRLFRYQGDAADYFHVSRPTITRYENGINPPLGYITTLARLLVERQDEATALSYRQQLLKDINRIIRHHYPHELPVRGWAELDAIAADYMTEQQARGQAKEIAQNSLTIQLPSTNLALPGQVILKMSLEATTSETAIESSSEQATAPAEEQVRHLSQKLPIPTYSQLFGAEPYLEKLLGYLQEPNYPAIISIQGIGGIGKTALADYTVRRFIQGANPLHDLVWISAKQEYLTETGIKRNQTHINLESLFDELGKKLDLLGVLRLPLDQKIDRLAKLLRSQPYLVIIDNLETVEDFQRVVPWLEQLAMPTKFLLTTREYVPALTTVALIRLGELDREASLALIHHVAQAKEVDPKAAEQIYTLVGGNPLAMILTVSQMQYLPAEMIFQNIKLGTAEEIYRYVYWKTWMVLNNEARQVLFSIQRAGDQANWELLALTLDLPEPSLQDALQHLIDLSLVQPQQTPEGQLYYTIHRLTSTFLSTEVLGWK